MSKTGLPAVFAGGSFLLPFPPQEPRLKGENRARPPLWRKISYIFIQFMLFYVFFKKNVIANTAI